jgi:Domain of unknown function (DUF4287)
MLRLRDLREEKMTFQAYLDNIEKQTGVAPDQWVALFRTKGFPATAKARLVTDWLAAEYKLSNAYGMAIVKLLRDRSEMK